MKTAVTPLAPCGAATGCEFLACYKPIHGYYGRGKLRVDRVSDSPNIPMTVPCGRCVGCRIDHSKEWAIRCMHEASCHAHNQFVTLTYNEENLPQGGSLRKKDFQDFIKRVRQNYGYKIRYFHCGEYGEKLSRPHYHALLFGLQLADQYPWAERRGNTYFRSPKLEKLWGKGHVEVSAVTFKSAAYVARYIMKKVGGERAEEHYQRVDNYGVIHHVEPEYATMSLKPGLGEGWYNKYGNTDCHNQDFIVYEGKRMKPPRYYDTLLERQDPARIERIRLERKRNADRINSTPERLAVREKVHNAKLGKLHRSYENDS